MINTFICQPLSFLCELLMSFLLWLLRLMKVRHAQPLTLKLFVVSFPVSLVETLYNSIIMEEKLSQTSCITSEIFVFYNMLGEQWGMVKISLRIQTDWSQPLPSASGFFQPKDFQRVNVDVSLRSEKIQMLQTNQRLSINTVPFTHPNRSRHEPCRGGRPTFPNPLSHEGYELSQTAVYIKKTCKHFSFLQGMTAFMISGLLSFWKGSFAISN